MTKNEKRLLAILLLIAAICLIFVGGEAYVSYRHSLSSSIQSLKREIAKMQAIEAELPAEEARLEEIKASTANSENANSPSDIYDLANQISQKTNLRGITIQRSSIVGKGKQAILQLNLSGDMTDLIALAQDISQAGGFSILSLRAITAQEGKKPELIMGIGYAQN
jgi:hypothetical protein